MGIGVVVKDFDISLPCVLGVIFDVSSQRDPSGKKYFDVLIQNLRELTTKGANNIVYVAHPENKMPQNTSDSHAQLVQYSQPVCRSLRDDIKKAIHTVGEYSDDVHKIIIFFTEIGRAHV